MGARQARRVVETVRERMCIVTRAQGDESDLIRFVVDPQGTVVPDVKATLPGRGAWVTADRKVLRDAVRKNSFARALKSEQPVGGLDDLVERTQTVLRKHALGSIGLARKSGLVVTGFSKVHAALKAQSVALLVHAVEAESDGRAKLDRVAGHVGVEISVVFQTTELSLALGQEHVIHAALLEGPGAARFLAPIRRLEAFCFGSEKTGSTRQALGPLLGDKTTV